MAFRAETVIESTDNKAYAIFCAQHFHESVRRKRTGVFIEDHEINMVYRKTGLSQETQFLFRFSQQTRGFSRGDNAQRMPGKSKDLRSQSPEV